MAQSFTLVLLKIKSASFGKHGISLFELFGRFMNLEFKYNLLSDVMEKTCDRIQNLKGLPFLCYTIFCGQMLEKSPVKNMPLLLTRK